jgi:hypothetical protein
MIKKQDIEASKEASRKALIDAAFDYGTESEQYREALEEWYRLLD